LSAFWRDYLKEWNVLWIGIVRRAGSGFVSAEPSIFCCHTTETVKCSTYKDIVEQLKLTHLDLFVLDVEGHEVDVISGMVGCDILPDVFVIEHGHRNTSFFVDVIKILNAKYTLDHVSHVNSFFVKIK
jgi:hypothetical protein